MKTLWFQICVILFFLAGFFVVTYLTDKGLALFAGGSLGICAIFGWILTFQNKAVKFRHGLSWTLLGILQPVPSNWIKPLEVSWPERLMVLLVSLLFGAFIRIFWITKV
jgi:hypothetical protein